MDDKPRRAVHLVGACGSGMKALAELLLDARWTLSGSDLSPPNASTQRLIERGLSFFTGHSPSNVPSQVDCVVYSSAIPEHNVERLEACRRQIPQFSYSQMIGQLMPPSSGVCIAGTHGKSTTTAMTSCILDAAARLGAAIVGAELCDRHCSGWIGAGDLFTVESCEFQYSFLHFSPRYAVILGIEHDHFDCYPDFQSIKAAFQQFAERTNGDGILLVNHDCMVSRAVSASVHTAARRVSFAIKNSADWTATQVETPTGALRMTIFHHGREVGATDLKLWGTHNLSNALAAAAICLEIGVSIEVVLASLGQFSGIHRRMEQMPDWRERTFFDDYAHHPTAVKVTLNSLRKRLGPRRIVCIFQPHQVLRTRALMDEFAGSFADVDEAWIASVYAARESHQDEPYRASQELAEQIAARGVVARSFTSLDQIVTTLEDATRPGDVIVTMGAGDIDWVYHEFTRRFQ